MRSPGSDLHDGNDPFIRREAKVLTPYSPIPFSAMRNQNEKMDCINQVSGPCQKLSTLAPGFELSAFKTRGNEFLLSKLSNL
jgi:hypothetical protein